MEPYIIEVEGEGVEVTPFLLPYQPEEDETPYYPAEQEQAVDTTTS